MARKINGSESNTNYMAHCACGKLWDYVEVDGFGNVSTLTNDIHMQGSKPIHVPFLRGMQCGREIRIVRMGTRPQGSTWNKNFLRLRDDRGNLGAHIGGRRK